MRLAQNPQTGEFMVERGGEWVPISAQEAEAIQNPWYETIGEQALHHGRGMLSTVTLGLVPPTPEAEQPYYDYLREHQPIASMAGAAAPHLAGALVPGGAIGKGAQAAWWLAKTAGIGAGLGAADIESGGTATERALYGGAGAVAGDIVGRTLARIGGYFLGHGTRAVPTDEMAQQAMARGARVTPGMRTMDEHIRAYEQRILTSGAGKGMRDTLAYNQRLVNKAAADAIGEPLSEGGRLTKNVLQAAEKRLGGIYDDIFNQIDTIRVNPEAWQQSGLLTTNLQKRLADGEISGKLVRQLRSHLSKLTKSADEIRAENALDALEQLDDIIARRLGPDELARFDQARNQWRALYAVERGRAMSAGGDVNYASMSRALDRAYGKRGYKNSNVEGLHQLVDSLAEISPRPGSYTPEGMATAWKDVPKGMVANRYVNEQWMPAAERLLDPAAGRTGIGRSIGGAAGTAGGPYVEEQFPRIGGF